MRLGSVEEGYDSSWLAPDENQFLTASTTRPEASVVRITRHGITVVGQGKCGMLYGVQTVNQLVLQAAREERKTIPCLTIRDWPHMKWRCLSPTLTWYSGWNGLEGYDLCNWSGGEWKRIGSVYTTAPRLDSTRFSEHAFVTFSIKLAAYRFHSPIPFPPRAYEIHLRSIHPNFQ